MFQVIVEQTFRASHQLVDAKGIREPLHWHEWKVAAAIESDKLDKQNYVIDFILLKEILRQAISDFDGQQLDNLPCFEGKNASAEKVAHLIFQRISGQIPSPARCVWVEITEAAGCRARFIAP